MPEELAREKGIETGDRVRVSLQARQARGARPSSPSAWARSRSDGKKVYQIGIPIHWGFVGIAATGIRPRANWLANALTPFVGDANSRTPEFKAFLVNIEKI